jgi:hypothetical protein
MNYFILFFAKQRLFWEFKVLFEYFLENFISRPSGPNTALCAPQRPRLTTPLFPPDII